MTKIVDKLNRPVRDLRISVTDKCNFRCSYCMPEDVFGFEYKFLPRSKILTFEEITRLTKIFTEFGVVKVRLTGGEPLLRAQVERLVAGIAGISEIQDIAMTTNGSLLTEKAQLLKQAGLKRLTMSLDTLNPDLFKKLAGKHLELNHVLEGLRHAVDVGFRDIKINSVIQRGVNDNEILDLVRFTRENGYVLRFIEYMDVGNLNGWNMALVVPARQIIDVVSKKYPLQPVDRNYESETALRFKYEDGVGEVGFIASVSKPFCGACSRVRLSADGKLYTCLFATDGLDIKTPMRDGASDSELRNILMSMWAKRSDRYSEIRTSATTSRHRKKKIEMYQIGG